MQLTDQLAAKLLAHIIKELGMALAETLCTQPDRKLVRSMIDGAKSNLAEFEDAYFGEEAGVRSDAAAKA
ncbi:MAG: hypothetical protein EXQ89_07320 [Rhodospirillaceae bacterium]|nr:hypothetical protein [Rhodospirillaceae bacterium]